MLEPIPDIGPVSGFKRPRSDSLESLDLDHILAPELSTSRTSACRDSATSALPPPRLRADAPSPTVDSFDHTAGLSSAAPPAEPLPPAQPTIHRPGSILSISSHQWTPDLAAKRTNAIKNYFVKKFHITDEEASELFDTDPSLPEDFEHGTDFSWIVTDLLIDRSIAPSKFLELRRMLRDQRRDCRVIKHANPVSDPPLFNWPEHLTTTARVRRAHTYTSYASIQGSNAARVESITARLDGHTLFTHMASYNMPRPTIMHFQLRHTLAAVDTSHVYYNEKDAISCLDLNTGESTPFMSTNLIKPTSVAANSDYLVTGGFFGHYSIKPVPTRYGRSATPVHQGVITYDRENITNYVEALKDFAVFSSNDCHVRTLDVTTNSFVSDYEYEWAMNCVATHGKSQLLVGDSRETLWTDASSGKIISRIQGHWDYSFAAAWSPDGRYCATGNQDMTCRIYDSRRISEPLAVIPTQIGACRSLKFDPTGTFLAVAEPVDHVHIVDVRTLAGTCTSGRQPPSLIGGHTLNFWGEVTGIDWLESHNEASLVIGNSDRLTGGIMRYKRSFNSLEALDQLLDST
ncbi:hypothetical protein CANCADRAFT_32096 [Tortispora caseinolytica NRRL Y-17796]|uniref:DUF2415 domain-containing protein n=1 Tax=Tortispora caseinolytica NRRL Y-17796 TaxID=767744 RepID=A0A1E4T9T9_9ASCO|nr:hypothetical protein CANCADRAFT_32096 [Tortispora caseinolytica NRRL Y-17796]